MKNFYNNEICETRLYFKKNSKVELCILCPLIKSTFGLASQKKLYSNLISIFQCCPNTLALVQQIFIISNHLSAH